MRNRVRVMCKPGSVGGLGGRPPRSTRPGLRSFRATTATDLLRHDVPLEQVQYLLGHSDARTTDLYNRTNKEVSRNVVDRISI
jgi:integrase